MEKNKLYVLTIMVFFIVILFIAFTCQNFIILGFISILIILVYICTNNLKKLKQIFKFVIPLSIWTVIINVLFNSMGNLILIDLKIIKITLEAVIYSIILADKLFITVNIFMLLDILLDSDNATAFFSSVIPKTTLTIIIGTKLLHRANIKFTGLREIYSIRGMNLQEKNLKQRIKANIPMLSVLLNNLLEASFDIGEAAFIRGFLSKKRTTYEKQKIRLKDYVTIFFSTAALAFYIIFILKGNFYDNSYNIVLISIFNKELLINLLLLAISFQLIIHYGRERR